MLTSNKVDLSTKNQSKSRAAEPQSVSELEIANQKIQKIILADKCNQSVVTSSCREISEFHDSHQLLLDDVSTQPNCGSEVISSVENKGVPPTIPQPLQLEVASKVDDAILLSTAHLRADVCFVEPDRHCCEQSTKIHPNPSPSTCPERNKSSRLYSLVAKSSRIFAPKPHTAAVESSVETLFDYRLPHHRIVRKRILSCYGTCGEGSTINALWRRFLLAIFGIQDDEVWTGKVGSAVIHPDSRFSRGEKRERHRDKKSVREGQQEL
jgi:hypothetical protein